MRTTALAFCLLLAACATTGDQAAQFTIAVIPDTQNYVDYRHQRNAGFALDGQSLFIEQMKDIAARRDVVFVAAVGDVWQHSSIDVDPVHAARGRGAIDNPYLGPSLTPTPLTRSVEIPGALAGYRILAASGKPFGVAPGNHDYDAFWSIEGFPPRTDRPAAELESLEGDLGVIHVGGLDNFRSVFGNQGEFFIRRDWYVDSFRGGANSAQVFEAGGYRFLHIALEMSPDDNVLRWAAGVLRDHPNYPTIVTTHDYLNTRGERRAYPVIRYGNPVYQILADYQGRGQAGIDAGQPVPEGRSNPVGLGDGWYRLMHFDLRGSTPEIRVETWSSHYHRFSRDMANYADWYRDYEQPGMSDEAFYAADEFTLELVGFHERFRHQGSPD